MIKYIAETWYEAIIKRVQPERESEKCIWVNGSKMLKRSDGVLVCDSFDEAYEAVVGEMLERVNGCNRELAHAEEKLARARALKNPNPSLPEGG